MARQMLPSNWFLGARLKLRHLQLFVALDMHRNLHRAAQSIGISQPAASKLLNDMERALGLKLFTRLPRGVLVNEYGEIMVRRARMALAELTRAGDEFLALREGYEGVVSIGTVGALGVDLVVKAIKAMQRDHPRLQLNVEVGNSEMLTRQLLEGAVDFAICRIPKGTDASQLVYRELGDRQLSFICRWNHPLVTRRDIQLSDLVDAQWVLQPPGMLARKSIDTLFRENELPTPHRVINSTSFLLTLAMLRDSDALSVVAHPVAKLFVSLGSIAILLEHERFSIEPIGIVRTKNRPLSPGAAAVLDAIGKSVAAESAEQPLAPSARRMRSQKKD